MKIDTKLLVDEIIKMGELVEKSFQIALDPDSTLQQILDVENKINKYHTSIDEFCLKYIALKNPVAKDLRLSLAILKINADLERIGDLIPHIKRTFLRLGKSFPFLETMAIEVKNMLKNGLESFIRGDIQMAGDVIKNDVAVDEQNRNIIKTYLTAVEKQGHSFDEIFHIIMIAKWLERIGDHATNLCESVIFIESGKDIRHGHSKL